MRPLCNVHPPPFEFCVSSDTLDLPLIMIATQIQGDLASPKARVTDTVPYPATKSVPQLRISHTKELIS